MVQSSTYPFKQYISMPMPMEGCPLGKRKQQNRGNIKLEKEDTLQNCLSKGWGG